MSRALSQEPRLQRPNNSFKPSPLRGLGHTGPQRAGRLNSGVRCHMKIRRAALKGLPFALACTLAGAATVWTPIACGCVSAWETIAYGIGRKDISRPEQITARAIADGLAKEHQGKIVRARDLPFATSIDDCAASGAPSPTIRCRWWLWESASGKKGYDVVIRTAKNGLFEHVSVVSVVYQEPSG